MKEQLIKNSITNAYNKLSKNTLTSAYKKLYSDFKNEKLQIIFSTLHDNIITCFNKMNERLPVIKSNNNYYWANESRILKSSIETSFLLQKELENSEYAFNIDDYYKKIFEQCLEFLKTSNGSEIPTEMEVITIYAEIPIFTALTNITTPNTNQSYTLHLISSGSYGNVYKYYDEFYQCHFALKRLKRDTNEKEFKRFEKEFEMMKKINNPYILKAYSFNKNNKEYIMEYADTTLEKYIDTNNQKITKQERINLGSQILKGISILWENEILHRDISFKNILLKQYDKIFPVVKISDFGLIKEVESDLTSKNTEIKGSLNEISRLQKIGFQNYDHCDEIYALSRVLYFVATGRKNIDNAKCDFLNKGTDENIKNRYENLEELRKDFISFVESIYHAKTP